MLFVFKLALLMGAVCSTSVRFCYMQVARNQTNIIRVFTSWKPPSNKNDTSDTLWALVNTAIKFEKFSD